MEKSEILSYITANEISSYRLARITGLSQATLYRNLKEPDKMKKATLEKLRKAVIEIQKFPNEYLYEVSNDEKLAMVLQEEITPYGNDKDSIIKEQAEALKMSSEHIGKLLTQNGKLIDQVSQLMERVRELEGK